MIQYWFTFVLTPLAGLALTNVEVQMASSVFIWAWFVVTSRTPVTVALLLPLPR
jgi:hypothetical protein